MAFAHWTNSHEFLSISFVSSRISFSLACFLGHHSLPTLTRSLARRKDIWNFLFFFFKLFSADGTKSVR